MSHGTAWAGEWVARRLELDLRTTHAPLDVSVSDLVGLAVRRNPRRAHLLVSRVLGKHIPADPRLVQGAGLLLGEMVRRVLCTDTLLVDGSTDADGLGAHLVLATGNGPAARHATASLPAAVIASQPDPDPATPNAYPQAVVLGYAETATGLGHCVADALRTATSLHSTRRPVAGFDAVGGFEEEHSHASSHLLLPHDATILMNTLPLVLVDDELSTGTTTLNTIAELHRGAPRDHYVIATLVDLRSEGDRDRMAATATALRTRIDVVSLASGTVDLPDDVLVRGQQLAASAGAHEVPGEPNRLRGPGGLLPREREGAQRVDVGWPADVPVTGRHGFTPSHQIRLEHALPRMGRRLAEAVSAGGPVRRVLVLGHEELMYAPLRLACALAEALGDEPVQVRFSTTTRSPVLAVDDPGYAIRTRISFPAHDNPADGPGQRFAYNVSATKDGSAPFDCVVLVLDPKADTAELREDGGLLDLLSLEADCVLLAVLSEPASTTAVPNTVAATRNTGGHAQSLPSPLRGPAFGSYAAAEVAWLLKDLSGVALEAPTEEREEAIQSGGAHYAESLPVEYQPNAEYHQLFNDALAANAGRVAHAVGVVTELVLAARPDGAVLVSLARAGTPIGILMRRWAQRAHGLDLPHYAVSIVRGRGIDPVALKYLAAHHNPASVMFVDGWTGKGAIARELAAALERHSNATGDAFSPDLAVLADPGQCVELFGTREDYLVPSACLNSTVSGLVSRTVLNDQLIGPNDFHGAKFYAELANVDLSAAFLDAVTARFPDVADAVQAVIAVDAEEPRMASAHRRATWQGWSGVERISQDYGIGDVNLVKPGVGETTRVLLRRVPWKVLVRPEAHAELAHIRLLAAQRGVPVVEVPGLPYSCVGLIHPRFTRGATGATGTSAIPVESPPVAGLRDVVRQAALDAGLPARLSEEVALHAPARPRPPGRLLVACDLDRTLIYSAQALGLASKDYEAPHLVVAEVYEGVPISFCTRDAESMLTALANTAELVPTTTRTRAQLARIRLPVTPRYAIAANGGFILESGVADAEWSQHVAASLESGCAPLAEVVEHLVKISDPLWLRKRRVAEDLFAYLVVERDELPATFISDLSEWSVPLGWSVSLQGRKVYCVPDPLTKSAAVAEVARRCAAVWTVAAGDSILDADMLAAADESVRPAHGELHDVGWHSPRLTVTDRAGVLAGQEIAARLLASALSVS